MKGSVPTSADLPATATQGDAYIVQEDDSLWIYDGTAWTSGGSIQGPQGVQGPTGAQGIQGVPGDTGPQGAQGVKGDQGIQGEVGPKGDTGAQGIQGPQGVQGETGPIGPTGPASFPDAPDATTYGRKSGAWVNLANHEKILVDAAGSAVAPGNLTANGGAITANSPAANATLNLIKNAAANASDIYGALGSKVHWLMRLGQGDAADNFALVRYNDAGVYIGACITARRDTGGVTIGDGVTNTGGLTVAGNVGMTSGVGPMTAANGMGMTWDGANANFLRMGAGHASNWTWQWNRGSGQLTWLGGTSNALLWIDGSGNLSVNGWSLAGGRITSNSGDAAAFYAPYGGIRADGGSNAAFYAPNGGLQVGKDVNAGGVLYGANCNVSGRVTANGIDFAAIYVPGSGAGLYAPTGRFRSDWGVNNAFSAETGGMNCHANFGYLVSSYQGSNPFIVPFVTGNPNWNTCIFQAIHYSGAWAGGRFWGNGVSFDFNCSTGHFIANGVDLGSDLRTKSNLEPVSEAASLFSGAQAYEYDRTAILTMEDRPTREVGLIAQHIQKLMPKAVIQNKVTKDDPEPLRRVDLGAMNALQSQAIGELYDRIRRLESRIEELELEKEPA